MGTEDLPRVIDYVLKKTGHEQLQYVGHSMGTTMFYVMASMLPQYNAKIRAMFSLAPVAYMGNIRSLVGGFGTNIRENVWVRSNEVITFQYLICNTVIRSITEYHKEIGILQLHIQEILYV